MVKLNKNSKKMERSQIPNYVMSTLCRICAERSSKLLSIFETESLSIKMCKCLPIQVNESDYLPLKICESCYVKINESYALYIRAHEADQRLKKLWKILLKETITDYSEIDTVEEKTVAVINNHQPFVTIQEVQNGMSPSDLVINIPDEVTYHSVEISGDDGPLVGKLPDDVKVVTSAISLEVTNEDSALKNYEEHSDKSQMEESQTKKSYETENKFSGNEQSRQETTNLHHCHSCPFKTSLLATLKVHESIHSEKRPYLCDTCGKSFKNAKYLKSHLKTHSGVRKKHICSICSKGFLKNFFLQEHMNSHTGETPYKCMVCKKEFREKGHLRQHKWTHLGQKFACPICGSKFNRKGNMTEHIKQFHKNGTSGDNVKSKTSRKKLEDCSLKEDENFKCSFCNSKFLSHLLLNNHLKIHSEQKRVACTICGKKFRYSGSLTYHRRTAHTGERPFQCSYCDQKFSLRSLQKIHERKYHTFEHPYKCTFCSRPFTNSSSLRNHLYVHSRDKMFKCEECGKKFARRSNLLVHKKLHSGDRKFSCDQCEKNYIQKHDLLKHKKVHDPKSKPFFCKYCGNSFSHKKDSAKHAMCQFDFVRKNNSVIYSAEKFLESVTSSLKKDDREFSVEEEQQIILDSVDEFSREKAKIIYGHAKELNSAL